LFSARLNFVFATGLFATIVFVRFPEIEFSWWRALVLLAVLFSMYCFTLELERLGQALMGRAPLPDLSR
jgi:phosphotransferase system  glucose/maltose/N-acetylglucosamine-specific IIC component